MPTSGSVPRPDQILIGPPPGQAPYRGYSSEGSMTAQG